MKQIKITYFLKKSNTTFLNDLKKHRIFVAPETWKYFTNKKDAEKYLSEKSRELTLMLDELVNLTTLLYSEIWQFWYETKTNETVYFDIFRSVEKLINNTVFRSNSDNGDSFYHIQNNMRKIIFELLIIIDKIIKDRQQNNLHGKNRLLKVYRLQLNNMNKKIFNE